MAVKKIINNADNVCEELIEGITGAYSRYYERIPGTNSMKSTNPRKGKVSMVIGGGSGHEPLFSCYLGKGLGDAAACGNIFASPDPGTIMTTAESVHDGQGVLFIYGNYAGDNLNFDMAEEMLQDAGVKTAHVRIADDVASAPPERKDDRRGIAGDIFMLKIAGAACDAGLPLEECVRVCEKARDNMLSIGVATSSATLPGLDEPIFTLGDDEIEYGMGIHGEPGIQRIKMQPADVLTENLYDVLMKEFPAKAGDEVCVLINGLGSTTVMELSIVYRKVAQLLDRDGIRIYDADVGPFATSQEMGGFSISLMKLDDELKKYYNAPCYCPYYAKEAR